MTTQTLSRAAALAYIRQQRGCEAKTAEAILALKPVAARRNTGFGQTTYYYSKDLNA